MKSLIVAFLVTISPSAFAISEVNYVASYQEKVIPVLHNYQYGEFSGTNKTPIHYATYTTNPASTRCLVILPGRTEPIEKYAEVVENLDTGKLAGQFTYFLMDHRGQGSSGRMLSDFDNYQKGYVDHFENYANDIKIFMDTVVAQKNCSHKLLLAHSLGAGISIDFLQRYPEYFDRAALTSPMLKILTAPYSYTVARSIVLASMAAGRGKKFAVGQKGFNPTRDFENNDFTTSPVRYEMAMSMFDMFPKAKLGGVTNRWLNEVMSATHNIRKNYRDIKIPLLVFNAGNELYSEPSEMARFCDEAPYCVRTFLPTSKHEVLMDRDANRDVVMTELTEFLK
ncbi:MAG: alpha/beta fold hydrolase [Bacteriovorax sp.]|nr:alpha/beta fold hydrolase [Bacteriovorax sp.]